MPVQLNSNLGHFALALSGAVGDALFKEAEDGVERIKQSMQAGKSGRHHPGAVRQSSAPGESPAVQSTRLINSIKANRVSETECEIISDDPKAPGVEFGRIYEPRPFMTPEAYRLETRLPQRATEAVERLIQGFAVQ